MRHDLLPEQEHEQTLGHRLGYRMADILWHRHFEIAELASALLWVLWGIVLLNPYANSFASAPSFWAMASLAPEWAWGLGAILLGINQFCAMLWEVRYWRLTASGLLFCWGLFVGSLIGFANPFGTGMVAYTIYGLLSGFAFLRSFREHAGS